MLVALSSGTLGWLGLYLRNRNATTSSVLAASPSVLAHNAADILSSQDDILTELEQLLTPEQIDQFVTRVSTDPAETLRDTAVDLFGHKQ